MDNIKISILIPTYNAEKYLKDAIDSCINQNFTDLYEIIIVDDGSTDNTINIIESYNNRKIRLFRQSHEGISAALNYGIEQCKGKYIVRMDADDIMYINRLTIQYKYMESHPDIDVLSNGFIMFNEDMITLANESYCNTDNDNVSCYDILSNISLMHHPCVIFKKNINIKYESKFDGYEDRALWFNLLLNGYKIASSHLPVLRYRYRKNSCSHCLTSNQEKSIIQLDNTVAYLLKQEIGIYYIATGIYKVNFSNFLKSINNLFPQLQKRIILLSDELEEYDNYSEDNVIIERHYINDLPWPLVTLLKFHYIQQYKVNSDYIFYINANANIEHNIISDWFDFTKINVTKHFAYRLGLLTTTEFLLPSDDNPNSTSYIGNIEYNYCMGGFFGGPANLIYKMCEEISNMIDIDLNNNIIAKWHDETYLNKWLYAKNYDDELIHISDIFYSDKHPKETNEQFIYLEYKDEDDVNLNKKKKLINKIPYGHYVPEHNYEKDKIITNKI